MAGRITQQDLKIMQAERMTDNDDGGGLMGTQEVSEMVSGLFPPVDDVAATIGRVQLRKVFGGVFREDTEMLSGGHFALTDPPDEPNVSMLVFGATAYADERAQVQNQIEAYVTKSTAANIVLMGEHPAGTKTIQSYVAVDGVETPKIGDVLVLSQAPSTLHPDATEIDQYIRVTDVTITENVAFVDDSSNSSFSVNLVVLEISDPLEALFYGGAPSRYTNSRSATCRILTTSVSDAAKYYGVKSIANPITSGDLNVAVDSLFEKIVPTATTETPHVDDRLTVVNRYIKLQDSVKNFGNVLSNAITYYEHGFYPGSVEITGFVDNGNGTLSSSSSEEVIFVDYARGTIETTATRNYGTMSAIPAVAYSANAYSARIDVTIANQGTSFAPLLRPVPTLGSIVVDYVALGQWYQLRDVGNGILEGEGGTGRLDGVTGSLILTLKERPDVGSPIIIKWAGDTEIVSTDDYSDRADVSPEPTATLSTTAGISPGTFEMNVVNNGIDRVITDNGGGGLMRSGTFVGSIDYETGHIEITTDAVDDTNSYEWECFAGTGEPVIINGSASFTANTIDLSWNAAEATGDVVSTTVLIRFHEQVDTYTTIYAVYDIDVQMFADGTCKQMFKGQQGLPEKYAYYPHATRTMSSSACDLASGTASLSLSDIACRFNLRTVVTPTGATGQLLAVVNAGSINLASSLTDSTLVSSSISITCPPANSTVQSGIATHKTQIPLIDVMSSDSQIIPRSVVINTSSGPYYDNGGVIYSDIDTATGVGTPQGSINYATGVVVLDSLIDTTSITYKGMVSLANPEMLTIIGRTDGMPVKTSSFAIRATTTDSQEVLGYSDNNGAVTGDISGEIDYNLGFFVLESSEPVIANEIYMNNVTYSYLPLDSDLIGINAVRLPADGRVPIFRNGDMVLITNKKLFVLPGALSAGLVVQTRLDADRICIFDANNNHLLTNMYTADVATGEITFTSELDLTNYTLPLTAVSIQEERNRIVASSIDGTLTLQFQVQRDYDIADTVISSVLIVGDLQAAATENFSQKTWTNEWSDERIGDDILARYNDTAYPPILVDSGTIREKWVLRFTSSSNFDVVGEQVGVIASSDIFSDLSPINPATNTPYFTLQKEGFGSGWGSGNACRFNTLAANEPAWLIRTITPSANDITDVDAFTLCVRGNTINDL